MKIDVNNRSASKECDICYYWYFVDKVLGLICVSVIDVMMY